MIPKLSDSIELIDVSVADELGVGLGVGVALALGLCVVVLGCPAFSIEFEEIPLLTTAPATIKKDSRKNKTLAFLRPSPPPDDGFEASYAELVASDPEERKEA